MEGVKEIMILIVPVQQNFSQLLQMGITINLN